MYKLNTIIAGTVLITISSANVAFATQINAGEENSAYHNQFCPPLQEALQKAQFNYKCAASKGARENIVRVSKNPSQLGFTQLDVFALERNLSSSEKPLIPIRSDIGRECLFLVTKNQDMTNFGQVAAAASKFHFILPPKGSGHTGTFEFLQQIDPDGLGKASNITHADSTDTALEAVLTSKDEMTMTVFVEFPDPDNARFKKIADQGGRFIPLIDRNILRQNIGGEKVYYAEETEIVNANWTTKEVKVVAACTPMIVFTGNSEDIPDSDERQDHVDLVKTIKDLDVRDLRPQKGWLSTLWSQTKSLSAEGVESILETSEKARDAAVPMMEKAKKMGSEAMEKAGEMTERAREAAGPVMEKAKEMGKRAMEKAGKLAEQAKESTKEMMKKDEQ